MDDDVKDSRHVLLWPCPAVLSSMDRYAPNIGVELLKSILYFRWSVAQKSKWDVEFVTWFDQTNEYLYYNIIVSSVVGLCPVSEH